MTAENRPGGYTAVPTWMIRDRSIKRSSVLVYASLSSRAGLGAIYPSQETIAEESGVSTRTVRTALRELEDMGVVERIQRRGTEGLQTSLTTAYLLHPHGVRGQAEETSGPLGRPEKATGNGAQPTLPIEVANRGSARATEKTKPHPLPADWMPSPEAVAFAAERGVDVELEADAFRAHAEANDRRVVVWHAAFRQWLIKARPGATAAARPQSLTEKWGAGNEWMERG